MKLEKHKKGVVAYVNNRGWGKIRLDDDSELNGIHAYYHIRQVDGERILEVGSPVKFDLEIGDDPLKKYSAKAVAPMSGVDLALSGNPGTTADAGDGPGQVVESLTTSAAPPGSTEDSNEAVPSGGSRE